MASALPPVNAQIIADLLLRVYEIHEQIMGEAGKTPTF